MNAVKYLECVGKPSLAYVNLKGNRKPGVLYLSGLMSSMNSPKALAMEQLCRDSSQPFLRFDYSGTYASSSANYVCNIKDWVEDGIEMFTKLTSGPQVIVGSSMGAFIMLHIAKRFPEKVVGMIGVSGAFHFIRTARMWRHIFNDDSPESKARVALLSKPLQTLAGKYALYEGMDKYDLFPEKSAKLDLPCDLHIIQGIKDMNVPWKLTLEFFENNVSDVTMVDMTMRKCGDHGITRKQDIALLLNAVERMCKDKN